MNNKPKKGHGFIYKYTSPSGKSYIGQTVTGLSERAGHNGKNYIGCKYFYSAIKKYGFQNFISEILGEFLIEELNSKERYFIEVFNTLAPNGYNIQPGGKYSYHDGRKIIYQYSASDGRLIRSWDGQKQASMELGISIQSLNQCLNGRTKTCGGFCWSFILLDKYPILEKISNKEKEVKMIDINNNVIKTFPSISEAASFVKGERNSIKKCCRGELKTAYGYKWACEEILKEKKYNNSPIKINQIDKNTGKIIHTFPSISEAARKMGANGTSLIRRAINNQNYTAYGFKWEKSQGSTTNDQ